VCSMVANRISLWAIAWFTCMWNVGGLRMLRQSVEQDAILKRGYFDHHDVGTYEMWAQTEGTRAVSIACNRKLCAQTLCQCWMHVPAESQLKRAGEQIIESGWDSHVFVWLACMQNVGAWRMFGTGISTWLWGCCLCRGVYIYGIF
jgi:hypothetical protein